MVSRRGNRDGVPLPRTSVDDLGLKTGDELAVPAATSTCFGLANAARRAQAVDRMRARGLRIPEGYAFDRAEANAR